LLSSAGLIAGQLMASNPSKKGDLRELKERNLPVILPVRFPQGLLIIFLKCPIFLDGKSIKFGKLS
jgi:hypothetical protein